MQAVAKSKTVKSNGSRSFKTRVDLPKEAREAVVSLLNQQLANLLDLYSQTKNAHWNVRGSNFFSVHKLFDVLAETVEEQTDTVAERLKALGGMARGTLRDAVAMSELDDIERDIVQSESLLAALADRYGVAANAARKGIDTADEADDAATADVLTALVRELDQALYFLQSFED